MAFEESTLNGQIVKNKKNKWILDSGCSRHITGNPDMLKILSITMEDWLILKTTKKDM